MTDVLMRLLGSLEVVGTDSRVTPPPGRVTTLLALLGLEVGRVVSADRLMDQVWGERPPRSGRSQRVQRLLTELTYTGRRRRP